MSEELIGEAGKFYIICQAKLFEGISVPESSSDEKQGSGKNNGYTEQK